MASLSVTSNNQFAKFSSVLVTLSFALLLECLIIQGENPGSREHSKNSLEL